ncbi:NifB/NifX family molybdenum-iron cluster-binding protein [Halosquirtibacter laminarini]|uniref:NifB/NifX family molybdenum-iron cluster-binding protein n=1 Tax=Halosquirtibacter laminarini TaxID=3374600 RepID=A0AC61NGB4_9BACT|nr:NifB/NifX family molybdenum-iron cluster-binding protein [Prolixibacteraceae bacterium]
MKIVIPTTAQGTIDSHFGHCASFMVYQIDENKKIVGKEKVEAPEGCGCKSNIAQQLKDKGVTLMLASNMGNGAVQKLSNAGIKVIKGCSGDNIECVNNYLNETLQVVDITCDHSSCKSH